MEAVAEVQMIVSCCLKFIVPFISTNINTFSINEWLHFDENMILIDSLKKQSKMFIIMKSRLSLKNSFVEVF